MKKQKELIDQEKIFEGQSTIDDDPLFQAGTVQRDYTAPIINNQPGIEDIREPIIMPPNIDFNDDNAQYQTNDSDQPTNIKTPNNDEDEDDDFGFELNGETAIYILDFALKYLKERYKISEKLLEKYGITPEILRERITVQGQIITVSELADQINSAMDEVGISNKDKNAIKKLISKISKKHNVKLSIEMQLLITLGKIGLETHLSLKAIQMHFIEKISSIETFNTDHVNEKEQIPLEKVEEVIAGETKIFKKNKRIKEPSQRRSAKKRLQQIENEFKEPGEK